MLANHLTVKQNHSPERHVFNAFQNSRVNFTVNLATCNNYDGGAKYTKQNKHSNIHLN